MQDHAICQNRIVNDLDAIFSTLQGIHSQTLHMLAKRDLSLEDASQLTELVTCMRVELTALAQSANRLKKCTRAMWQINNLKQCYWELEGIAKETRNDLYKKNENMS
jgi:hypothetical protein